MQIGCTKKLLECLEKDEQPCDKSIDPFYSWTANLITVNRRKTLVAINDAVRCGFVIYGLTAPVRKQLDRLLREGIYQTLLAERIAPQLIEKYLNDCGKEVSYTRTGERSVVSRLNSVILDLQCRSVVWVQGETFQLEITRRIDSIPYSADGQYYFSREELRREFSEHYGVENPCSCAMAVLNIRLLHTECFRQIRVPASMTLWQLREVIHKAMCWQDNHMHRFYAKDGMPLTLYFLEFTNEDEEGKLDTDEELMEYKVTIQEAFEMVSQIRYLYNFRDNWEHELTLVCIEEQSQNTDCRCTLASGDAPPEEIGGPETFSDFLELLKHPEKPESQQVLAWARVQLWSPLNVEAINRSLKSV